MFRSHRARAATLALALAVFTAPAARANTYTVSTSGGDSNPGTAASPWRTLQKAANTVRAGDVVNVTAGTYVGFQVKTSGTASNPITFKAEPGVLVNQPNASTPDCINDEGGSYVIIDGFTVANAPRIGIRAVTATGVVIRNNIVSDCTLTGILTGWTPSVLIENNKASGSKEQHGIYVSNSNTPDDNPIVRGNECFGNNQNGIQFNGDCWEGGDGIIEGALIENNRIHDNNWKGFSLISVQKSVIQNNLVYDNGISAGAGGIHLTDQVGPSCGKPSSYNLVVNNTIVEPRIACIRMTDGSVGNIIFNNLCVANSVDKTIVDEVGGNLIDTVSNIRVASTGNLFVDPSAKDFHLAPGSSAIDAGLASWQERAAPALDFDGAARPAGAQIDIGAFEAGATAPGGDVTPPAARITAPADGSTVTQVTTVTATASDDVGVASVEILLDGAPIGPPDTQAPYTASMDPAAHPNGFYTLTARARDTSGNVGVSPGVSVFLQAESVPDSIPSAHPRMGLINGRLSELRQLACYDDAGNKLSGCTPSAFATSFFDVVDNNPGQAEAWQFALAYMVSGKSAYATQAISLVDQQVACDYPCVASADKTFLYVRNAMRNVALVYDWLYDQLSASRRAAWVDYMNKIMFITWNEVPEANAIFDTGNIATSDADNSQFYNYLLATTYVALATHGENPGTFTDGGVTHTLYLLMDATDPNSDRYTDVYPFLMAKIRQQALPALDTKGSGGGWVEGTESGRTMKRTFFEALLLLQQTAGVDYFNDPAHPFAREAAHYAFYAEQPGNGVLYPGGDASDDPTLAVNAYDREVMLLLADGLSGSVEGQYARYWLTHDVTAMAGVPKLVPYDFYLDRPGLPERDFRELPSRYAAGGTGWINSRSDWSDNAVSVSFTSTDRIEARQHADQNHFTIYEGGATTPVDGWLVTDVQPFSNVSPRGSQYHNTLLVGGTSQRFGAGTGAIVRQDLDHPDYVYVLGDASDAYWTNPGDTGHGTQKMVDVFQREMVHILPGYVVVFDRVSLASGFESTPVSDMFHYPKAQPTQSGNTWVATGGANRVFQQVVLPDPAHVAWVDENAADPSTQIATWRMELSDATVRPNYRFMNVFYVTRSTTSQMPLTTMVASQDGSMIGAVIHDPSQEHVVMFSADPKGLPPAGNIIYDVGMDLRSRQHLVDLVPDTGYDVSVAPVRDGYRVSVRSGGPYMTGDAGTLAFTIEDVLHPTQAVATR